MNFTKTLVGMFAIVTLAGCSGGIDSGGGRLTAAQAPAIVDTEEGDGNYQQGTANYTFDVSSKALMVDGKISENFDAAQFEGYPVLASRVSRLAALSRGIETKEQHLELWTAEKMNMAVDLRAEPHSIVWSDSGFQAERITYVNDHGAGEQNQTLAKGVVTFELRECLVPEDEKGQDQDQDKGEEQEKGQDQDQGKGEEQEKEPAPKEEICKNATVTIYLSEVEAPKGQDQGKGEEQEKGKDEGQEQGKGEEQEKGKGEEQGNDQGQGQDKGTKS